MPGRAYGLNCPESKKIKSAPRFFFVKDNSDRRSSAVPRFAFSSPGIGNKKSSLHPAEQKASQPNLKHPNYLGSRDLLESPWQAGSEAQAMRSLGRLPQKYSGSPLGREHFLGDLVWCCCKFATKQLIQVIALSFHYRFFKRMVKLSLLTV